MEIGIGFFVTVLVLAVLLGVVARFALAGNQELMDPARMSEGTDAVHPLGHETTLETAQKGQESEPHFHAL